MKGIPVFGIVLGLALVVFFGDGTRASAHDANLVSRPCALYLREALSSNDMGQQRAAMLRIIHLGSRMDTRENITALIAIYTSHKSESFRQLALMALYRTRNPRAMGYLGRRYFTEPSPHFKKLIRRILQDYYVKNSRK